MIDAAVIGGGVSGLAAAYDLARQGHRVRVLERQKIPGGNAISERIGGFLMEHGPSAMSTLFPVASEFSDELGLDDQRCDLGVGVRRRYLVGDGRLRGISIHPAGFLLSDYLSLTARMRLMAEFLVPRRADGAEETVAQFCTRRFGAEFTARVIDPLIGGMFAGRADELSMPAVLPRLAAMEIESRSILLAVMRSRRMGGKEPAARLFSWRDGVGTLPRSLAATLGDAVHTNVAVRRVRRVAGGFRVEAGSAGAFHARTVVIAAQPSVAAGLLQDVDEMAAESAGEIDAPPIAVVYLGYKREQVAHPLDGLGFLIPEAEGCPLMGAQFPSTMFPNRAPDGHVSVAGYVGGVRRPDLARLPADAVGEIVREELQHLIGARGDPVLCRVRHWPLGLPQYRPGHGARVTRLRALGERVPGLFVTGNYFAGPSIAACLTQARQTATGVHRYLLESWGDDTGRDRVGAPLI
jgi:oxygen-dependent protoporphyrinogen oxidase